MGFAFIDFKTSRHNGASGLRRRDFIVLPMAVYTCERRWVSFSIFSGRGDGVVGVWSPLDGVGPARGASRRRGAGARPAGRWLGSPRPREWGRGAPEAFGRLTAAVRRTTALGRRLGPHSDFQKKKVTARTPPTCSPPAAQGRRPKRCKAAVCRRRALGGVRGALGRRPP